MNSVKKPKALERGAKIRIVSPASPAPTDTLDAGVAELRQLGYFPVAAPPPPSEGYFAASAAHRLAELRDALADRETRAIIAARGGYGSNYLLDAKEKLSLGKPRIVMGYSDLTTLFLWLWKKHRWVTFYGPMAAFGFENGAGNAGGYDESSFQLAATQNHSSWKLDLSSEALVPGTARGTLLGGCLTLLQTSLGTPWELDARGAVLAMEDRGMKPYQVDRALMHLLQAGKFRGVKGIILGEFPDCESGAAGGPTVRDVCHRILGKLKIPVVWAARFGHTARPILTLPLGVRAHLNAKGSGTLEILEPAVI